MSTTENSHEGRKPPRGVVWAGRMAKGCIAFSALGLLLTYFGGSLWYFAGAGYWVPVYLLIAAIGLPGCIPVRSWKWMAAGFLCVVTALGLLVPCYFSAPNRAAPDQHGNLRILQFNLYEHKSDPKALIALINQTAPDVLLFQEYDTEWEAILKPIETMYPHHGIFPRYPKGHPDLGQYWRTEAAPPEVLAEAGLPAVKTAFLIENRPVTVFNVHTAAPFSPSRARRYQAQMPALARQVCQTPGPVIVAGDLNAGPWSLPYRNLIRQTGLISARQGFGILGSWPSFFGPLRIPLDHMLVSADIQVVRCWIGPGLGSDHRPVLTELCIPPAKNGD